jgi:pimeloyl-ACP methyl ester carboxylesterase
VALLVVLVAAGAIYEALSRHWAAVKYPPPGRLVDIGGRKIHLDCRGQGAPTVIFEAGLDISGSLSWAKVHDAVASVTRACAYDRAGIMWSDPKTTPQHADTVADDLHATLAAAGEKGPFILAGHSLGGPYSMAYTRKFGDQVAGLVFIDASHPDQVARFAEVAKTPPDTATDAMKIASSLAWTGIIRLTAPSEGQPNVPAGVTEQTNAYASTSLAGALAESIGIDQTLSEAGRLRTLGDRPLVVLTAMAPLSAAALKDENMSEQEDGRRRDVWRMLHDDEASWSTRSRHQLLPDASHYIQFDRPDVVITAVREVVDMVRSDQQKAGEGSER